MPWKLAASIKEIQRSEAFPELDIDSESEIKPAIHRVVECLSGSKLEIWRQGQAGRRLGVRLIDVDSATSSCLQLDINSGAYKLEVLLDENGDGSVKLPRELDCSTVLDERLSVVSFYWSSNV